MDNNMMQQMMQMMMQNQMMMQQMMMMQMNPQQNAITEQQMQVNSGGDVGAYLAEIERLKSELQAAQQQIESMQQELASKEAQLQSAQSELQTLKENVGKVEAFEGKKIEDLAQRGDDLSGDDYYEEKKREWNEEGLTPKEKHDRIKEYRDFFDEEEQKGLMEF